MGFHLRNTVLTVSVIGVLFSYVAGAESFTSSAANKAFTKYSPAVCLISYSLEITSPNSGETSRRDSLAAGIIVSPDGLVIGHGHMKRENSDPFNVRVRVGQGEDEKEYDAELLAKPDDINIAFLRISSDEKLDLPYIKFTSDVDLSIGEEVLLIGILGETLDNSRALMTRRIGAVLEKPRRTYCLDDSIKFGYVGGPVVNSAGQAVGVIGFDLSAAEGGEIYVRSGHPLIYQTDLFAKYIKEPPTETTNGEDSENDAYLGVFTQPLTDDLAEYWGLPQDGGVVVSTVVPGSPAANAGLRTGDVIVNFDGNPVEVKLDREVLTFTKMVRDAGADKQVVVELLRDGEPLATELTLATRPKTSRDAGEYEEETLGLTVRELTRDIRIMLNLSEDVQGVIVRRVKSGSPAQLARMRAGLIILNVGDYLVSDIESFKEAMSKVAEAQPKEVALFCRLRSATLFFRLEPRW